MDIGEIKEYIERLVDHAGIIAPSIMNFEKDSKYDNVTDEYLMWDILGGWEMEAKNILVQLSKINPELFSGIYDAYLEIKEASKTFHSKSMFVHKIKQLLVKASALIESDLS